MAIFACSAPTVKTVVVQLTLNCPLRCKHCYVSAGPEKTATLSNSYYVDIVETVSGFSIPPTIAITGGDPFARMDQFIQLVSLCGEYGVEAVANTSAFFAKTKESAENSLRAVRTLGALEISIDRFHLEFLGQKHIINCSEVARELGISVTLALQKDEKSDPQVLDVLSKLPWAEQYWQDFAQVGSRNNTPEGEFSFPREIHAGCKKVGNIVIDEHGNVYPCSSAIAMDRRTGSGLGITYFSLGNLKDKPFGEILDKFRNSKTHAWIEAAGPTSISKFLGCHRGADSTYCDSCIGLFAPSSRDKFEAQSDTLCEIEG